MTDAITYHLEQFDGPLDLLLALIAKNKVNIADIPISLICDQYMEYLSAAQALDMEIASEFLVMASELMLIKSRILLPAWRRRKKTHVRHWPTPSCNISAPKRQPSN